MFKNKKTIALLLSLMLLTATAFGAAGCEEPPPEEPTPEEENGMEAPEEPENDEY